MTNHAPVILMMVRMLKTRIFMTHKILIFQIRKTLILKINIKQAGFGVINSDLPLAIFRVV